MSSLPSVELPSGFQWRLGTGGDRAALLHHLQLAFAEAFPQQTSWKHLSQTVDRYFEPLSVPVWWIDSLQPLQKASPRSASPAGFVWACRGTGQMTGQSVAYILALWVAPSCRRQGLGSAAIQAVEEWGKNHACEAIELQVFIQNSAAQSFYRHNGFAVGGMWMQRQLTARQG